MSIKHLIVGLWATLLVLNAVPLHIVPAKMAHASQAISIPHVIRFRVIANSDNPADQAVKLKVRDAVLRVLEPLLQHAHNEQGAARRIKAEQSAVNQTANHVLQSMHFPYRATVKFTHTTFPTKAYGSWVLPAGRYRALLVILGKGQGHNWWCVLFPSMCFIDMNQGLAVPVQRTALAASPPTSMNGSVPSSKTLAHSSQSSSSPSTSASMPPKKARPAGHIRVSWALPHFLRALDNIMRHV